MKTVSIYLDGRLMVEYPIENNGQLVGGPLTTDEEYVAAGQACAVEDGLLSIDDARRADYMVEGENVELPETD